MLRWHAKVISGVIMLVVTLLCFLLPVRLVPMFRRWGSRGQYAIDLLSCFAGGVFLATYLVFMAPDVRVLIEDNLTKPLNIEFPLPDFLIGIGFFIIPAIHLIVRLIKWCIKRKRDASAKRNRKLWSKRGNTAVNRVNSQNEESAMMPLTFNVERDADIVVAQSGNIEQRMIGNHRPDPNGDVLPQPPPASPPGGSKGNRSTGPAMTAAEFDRRFNWSLNTSCSSAVKQQTSRQQSSPSSPVSLMLSLPLQATNAAHVSQHNSQDSDSYGNCDRVRLRSRDATHSISPNGSLRVTRILEVSADSTAITVINAQSSVTRSVVLMLIQSIDSILDGIIIGLKSSVFEVWAISIGILIHSSVIAFCIGLQLARISKGRVMPVVLAAFVYSIMNPLGVTIATLVYELSEAETGIDIANGIIQALTSGCFIYVTFYEILEGQISDRSPPTKILAVLVGYLFLSAFGAIPESSQHHVTDLLNETAHC